MNRIKSALVGLLALATISPAFGQSAPAVMPFQSVYGRLGAAPGDTGPGQAIPFSTLSGKLLNGLCTTNNAMLVYSVALARWVCTPNQIANTVLAGPTTGGAAQGTYRALVGADLPLPGASSLGGVFSKTATASNWIRSLGTDGNFTISQPNFTDLAGSIAAGQVPNNLISNAMIRQGVARSVMGVTGNATANEADIQGTANQFLGVNSAGTALAFNTMSQDCTLATGVITCTKTNNVAFTAAATAAAGQYPGEPSTGNASAGNAGEFVTSDIALGSAVALTTATNQNLTSISVPAGDWLIELAAQFTGGVTTTLSFCTAGISTTSATPDNTLGRNNQQFYNNATVFNTVNPMQPVPPRHFQFSSTTTVFAVVRCNFATSTASAFGNLYAWRPR